MKKSQIVRKNHEFQSIMGTRDQTVSKFIVLYKRSNESGLRVGISISKRFANAVNRNKYKRKVKSILDNLNLWDKKMDVVLIIRKPFMQLSFEEMQKKVKSIFERV